MLVNMLIFIFFPFQKEGEPLVIIEGGGMRKPSSRSNAPSEAGFSTHPQPQPPIERMETMSVENRVERADRGRDEEVEDSEVDEASSSEAAMLRHSHVNELCREVCLYLEFRKCWLFSWQTLSWPTSRSRCRSRTFSTASTSELR